MDNNATEITSLEIDQTCPVCSKKADKCCAACRIVSYCSVEHQKAHWKTHKSDCCPIIVKQNEIFGRYLVAARDFKAGSVIIDEAPTLYGPDGCELEGYEYPLCLSCCVIMNDDNEHNRCSKCQWPICSIECERVTAHVENECKLFQELQLKFPPNLPIQACYKGIQIVRGLLLKEKDPKIWEQIMRLQDHSELEGTSRLSPNLTKFKTDLGVPHTLGTDQEWRKLLGIININSFSFMMKCETEDRSPSFGEFVYLRTSLISHSCAPNANWAIGCSTDFLMKIRATVDIKKGEMISVPYTYDNTTVGTHGRILQQVSFHCKCIRCLDPTELGTYNSAIKCYKCNSGFILPIDPVDLKSDWTCNNCGDIFPGSLVILFVESLLDEVESCDTVEELEKFIGDHRDKTLHPNHWVLNTASTTVISKQIHNLDELNAEQLERLLWHCTHFLQVQDVLAPGYSLSRAYLLRHISRILLQQAENGIRDGTLTDRSKIVEEMKKIYSYQKEAFEFWGEDPSYRPLNEEYGPEAREIIEDMKHVRTKYLAGIEV